MIRFIRNWGANQPIRWLVIAFLIILSLVAGCGDGDSDSALDSPSVISVAVDLPAAIDPDGLVVDAGGQTLAVAEDGSLSLNQASAAQVFAIAMKDGDPVAISFIDPDQTHNTISCLETAVSLILLKSDLLCTPETLLPELVDFIRTQAGVQQLGDHLYQALELRDTALVDPDESMVALLEQAVGDVAQSIRERSVDQ